MALFDRLKTNKVLLDDTHNLICTIEAAENVKGHTVYILKVQRGPYFETSWQTSRRYSDFDALNTVLSCSGLELPLPPKKVFGKLEREFVAERQQGLQAYINFVLSHPILSNTIYVKRFFDPESYSFNFAESSLQHVSMVFRSETEWDIVEPLPELGWRIRKQYFLVKSKSDSRHQSIMSWACFGPDRYLEDKDLTSIVKILGNVKHPFLFPSSLSCVSDKGGLVIFDFVEEGSLRDMLCKVKPKGKYLKKYGNPRAIGGLPNEDIRKYGRQILVALKFLHDRNLYHGHLHAGNLVIQEGNCKLLDLTNCVMGLPSLLRPYFLKLKKVQTVENIDVYSFGHVIYEMAFGSSLQKCSSDSFPCSCSPELRSVLEATISTEACRRGLPSVSDLLLHPFFASTTGKHEEKFHMKIPSQLKENLKKANEQLERRLKEEQKTIRRSERISKVQAQFSSEEEKKKRISERKKQQKIQNKSDVSQNGVTNSPTPTENSGEFDSLTPSPGIGALVPPPPPPPPPMQPPVLPPSAPPPPPPPIPQFAAPSGNNDRSALLSSIQGFNKGKLKKSETKDKSAPKI